MSWSLFLMGILPVVLFMLVEKYGSPRKAVITSMISVTLVGIYFSVLLREMDMSLVGEVLLFLGLGVVSLWRNDEKFVKVQPVISGVAASLFLLWHELSTGPYFVKAAVALKTIEPQLEEKLNNPIFMELFSVLSVHMIYLLLGHALILAWFALKKSTKAWGFWRLAIYPLIVALMFVDVQLIMAAKG